MTVMAERGLQTPQMSVEEFERIAAFAAKETDDAVRLEFINGRIGVKRVADGDHNTIVTWLLRRCMQYRPDLDLYQGQGLRVEKYRDGRARPDAVLVPEEHFAGHGKWADPSGVLLVLEVTSYDSDSDATARRSPSPTAPPAFPSICWSIGMPAPSSSTAIRTRASDTATAARHLSGSPC